MGEDKVQLNLGCGDDIREGWVNIDFNKDHPDVYKWDLNDGLPFNDNTIDKILISNCLEHIINPEHLVYECRRVLKPNGVFIPVLPSYSCELGHLRYYHRKGYFNVITKNGFELVSIRCFGFSPIRILKRFIDWFRSLLFRQYMYKFVKR